MKKLEEIITKEKSFLNAAGITVGMRLFDSLSTSYVISREVDSSFHFPEALTLLENPPAKLDILLNLYGASFEANPFARVFLEEYGINQGLLFHNLVVTVPTLALAYFLNKKYTPHQLGNTLLYLISGISAVVAVNNFYQ